MRFKVLKTKEYKELKNNPEFMKLVKFYLKKANEEGISDYYQTDKPNRYKFYSDKFKTYIYFVDTEYEELEKKEDINDKFVEAIKKTNTRAEAEAELRKMLKNEEKFKAYSLEDYKKELHKWFYFTDDEIVDVMLAGLIGEKIEGEPLWIFVIAPPGALKTETLRAFAESKDFYPLSDLTSKSFVSGLTIGKGKERRKVSDLLPELDGKVLIFKDFTTILEKGKEERAEIFAQLREIYDGSFAKKVGTMDETIRYDARFGLVAGVTPVIDKYWKMTQQLGERFIKIRWTEDIKKTTTRARQTEGKERSFRKKIQEIAMGFITNLDFSVTPTFDDEKFGEEIDKIAEFVAVARTPVAIQDSRTEFYHDFIPTPERPTRLVKQFKKASKCLALIRGKKEVTQDELNTILRIAKDTIPQERLKILQAIEKNHQNVYGCPRSIIVREVKLPESSIRRILAQMKMLDLVTEHQIHTDNNYQTQNFYSINDFIKNVLRLHPSLKQQGVVNVTAESVEAKNE